MSLQPSPFVLPLLLMAVLATASSVYVLRRRSVRGAPAFAALSLGAAWYALTYALELASVSLEQKVFWARLMYIGMVAVPAGLLGFAGLYTGRPAWSRWRTHLLLAIEPVIALTLLWTNDAHHLFWTRVWVQPYYDSFTRLDVTYGPVFFVHMAYTFTLVVFAVAMLAQAFAHASPLHRRQTAVLLVCGGLVGFARILVVAGLNPLDPIDPTPFVAGLSNIIGSWSLFRYHVFDLLPVARHVVVEEIDEGMAVVNAAGQIVDINAALLRLLGKRQGQVIGQAATPLLPFYTELEHRHQDESHTLEEFVWPASHPPRYFDLHRSTLFDQQGRLAGYMFVLHEITARRQAEDQLRQRSQELSTLYDTALEVASRLDLAQLLPIIVERAAVLLHATGCGMYLYRPASDELHHVAGYGQSREVIGHRLRRGEGVSGRVLESGQPLAVNDYSHWAGRSPQFDGLLVGAVLAVPVKWGEGVLGVIDVQRDAGAIFAPEEIRVLTLFANQAAVAVANAQFFEAAQRELAERKSAEAQLRESEWRYRTVVEDQTELISRATPDGRVTFVNEATCRFFCMERDQIVGQGMLDGVCSEDKPYVEQAVAAITPEHPVAITENRCRDGHGQTHWVQWADRGVFDAAGTLIGYQSVGRDISERKRAEAEREKLQAQLLQAQRMEAVGLLAGGVAHEFNNLLTVIEGNAELAMADLEEDDSLRGPLATVARTAQRAAALTRQLLAFGRRQLLQRREVDLNELIADFSNILQHAVGPDVRLQFCPALECKSVLADAGAIEQVLMNLALNSRDAMPRGGDLRIATAPATLDESFCRTRDDIKPGEYVRLTVSDTGQGMNEATLGHVFEPFFTTKDVGKGTGLGLSTVYGIIRQHGGLIEVQSQVGQGTRFDAYLPVYDGH